MKKIKLSLDDLEVNSFDVLPESADGSGTVQGHAETASPTRTDCPTECETGCDTQCYTCGTLCPTCETVCTCDPSRCDPSLCDPACNWDTWCYTVCVTGCPDCTVYPPC